MNVLWSGEAGHHTLLFSKQRTKVHGELKTIVWMVGERTTRTAWSLVKQSERQYLRNVNHPGSRVQEHNPLLAVENNDNKISAENCKNFFQGD